MVRAFLSAVGKEIRGMHEAAYLLAAFALLSQLLALVRDRLLAASFGAGHTLDLYYAAFRIPDFLFATVASLLSLYALLPVLSRLELEHPGLVISFMRQALVWFFVGMALVCGVVFIFAPAFVALAAPGLFSSDGAQLVLLTRILLLQPILLGCSNILSNLTQLRHRFVLYSVSPLLYNLGIIFGILVLYPRVGIMGLAWGVVLGAFLHMLVQLPFFAVEHTERTLPWRDSVRYLREVLALSVPRTLSLSATQISLFVLTALASLLSTGSISVFMFAWNLQAVPLTIIGVSYSVAAFPTLSRLFAGGSTREFVSHVETALRHVLFWAVPATVLTIVLRAQLVRVILGSGAFDWSATRLVAAALALLVTSLLAQSGTLLIARAYYAAGNTRKPFYFALVDVVVSIGGALLFAGLFHESQFFRFFLESLLRVADLSGTTVLTLALGLALGSIAEFWVGMWVFSKDFQLLGGSGLWRLTFQTFSSSVIGGVCAYGVLGLTGLYVNINTSLGVFLQGAAGGLVGLIVTIFMLWVLKTPELYEVLGAFARKFKDAAPVALEPSDISS
jgi:putative peptidoglycan lipid II flippase